MAKKPSSVLGVDIGSKSIKLTEMRIQGGTPTITALGFAEVPEGAVDHMGVNDPETVGAIFKELVNSSGANSNDVVVSIAGQSSVLVRTLEVPKMDESELRQHMEWEVSRNIPFAESTIQSDFQAFEATDPNSDNMDVVMAVSPQSAIDTVVDIVKKAGKKPFAIDVEPLGLARSIKHSYGSETVGETICVIETGHKTTAINFYRDGQLLLPRQVPIGGEMFTQAIIQAMNVDEAEAERIKREDVDVPESGVATDAAYNPFDQGGQTEEFAPYNPFAEPEEAEAPAEDPNATVMGGEPPAQEPPEGGAGDELQSAIAPVLDEFAGEVRRSVEYFRSKGGDVQKILVCGGTSKMKGLPAFLGATAGLPCELLDPVRGVSLNPKNPAEGTDSNSMQEFAVAVGNGLHINF
jgi:type IV pilus assembly protein PilM